MNPKELLESVFESDTTSRQYHFNDIVTALNQLDGGMSAKSRSSERFLAKMLQSDRRIPLHPRSSVPHSMSPEDMLKSLILRKLVEADPGNAKLYRTALEKAKEQASSITLKRIIDNHLKKIT